MDSDFHQRLVIYLLVVSGKLPSGTVLSQTLTGEALAARCGPETAAIGAYRRMIGIVGDGPGLAGGGYLKSVS